MALISPGKLPTSNSAGPMINNRSSPVEITDQKEMISPPGSPHQAGAPPRFPGNIYYPLIPPWQLALLTQQAAIHARGILTES